MSPSASSVVPGRHAHVDRRENAAIERDQMRRERDLAPPRPCSISAPCRWPNTPYADRLPCTSEKCVRSDGVLPAPETPDFASTMMSAPGTSTPAAASGASASSDAVG